MLNELSVLNADARVVNGTVLEHRYDVYTTMMRVYHRTTSYPGIGGTQRRAFCDAGAAVLSQLLADVRRRGSKSKSGTRSKPTLHAVTLGGGGGGGSAVDVGEDARQLSSASTTTTASAASTRRHGGGAGGDRVELGLGSRRMGGGSVGRKRPAAPTRGTHGGTRGVPVGATFSAEQLFADSKQLDAREFFGEVVVGQETRPWSSESLLNEVRHPHGTAPRAIAARSRALDSRTQPTGRATSRISQAQLTFGGQSAATAIERANVGSAIFAMANSSSGSTSRRSEGGRADARRNNATRPTLRHTTVDGRNLPGANRPGKGQRGKQNKKKKTKKAAKTRARGKLRLSDVHGGGGASGYSVPGGKKRGVTILFPPVAVQDGGFYPVSKPNLNVFSHNPHLQRSADEDDLSPRGRSGSMHRNEREVPPGGGDSEEDRDGDRLYTRSPSPSRSRSRSASPAQSFVDASFGESDDGEVEAPIDEHRVMITANNNNSSSSNTNNNDDDDRNSEGSSPADGAKAPPRDGAWSQSESDDDTESLDGDFSMVGGGSAMAAATTTTTAPAGGLVVQRRASLITPQLDDSRVPSRASHRDNMLSAQQQQQQQQQQQHLPLSGGVGRRASLVNLDFKRRPAHATVGALTRQDSRLGSSGSRLGTSGSRLGTSGSRLGTGTSGTSGALHSRDSSIGDGDAGLGLVGRRSSTVNRLVVHATETTNVTPSITPLQRVYDFVLFQGLWSQSGLGVLKVTASQERSSLAAPSYVVEGPDDKWFPAHIKLLTQEHGKEEGRPLLLRFKNGRVVLGSVDMHPIASAGADADDGGGGDDGGISAVSNESVPRIRWSNGLEWKLLDIEGTYLVNKHQVVVLSFQAVDQGINVVCVQPQDHLLPPMTGTLVVDDDGDTRVHLRAVDGDHWKLGVWQRWSRHAHTATHSSDAAGRLIFDHSDEWIHVVGATAATLRSGEMKGSAALSPTVTRHHRPRSRPSSSEIRELPKLVRASASAGVAVGGKGGKLHHPLHHPQQQPSRRNFTGGRQRPRHYNDAAGRYGDPHYRLAAGDSHGHDSTMRLERRLRTKGEQRYRKARRADVGPRHRKHLSDPFAAQLTSALSRIDDDETVDSLVDDIFAGIASKRLPSALARKAAGGHPAAGGHYRHLSAGSGGGGGGSGGGSGGSGGSAQGVLWLARQEGGEYSSSSSSSSRVIASGGGGGGGSQVPSTVFRAGGGIAPTAGLTWT